MLSMTRPAKVSSAIKRVDTEIDENLDTFFSLANDEEEFVEEESLRAKKRLLEKVMNRLKELILESQRLQEAKPKIDERWLESENQLESNWDLSESKSQRILSNRH